MKLKWPNFLRLTVALMLLVKEVRRVADALDRAYPPAADVPRRPPRQSTIEDLTTYDAEADYEAEQEDERLAELGLEPTEYANDV